MKTAYEFSPYIEKIGAGMLSRESASALRSYVDSVCAYNNPECIPDLLLRLDDTYVDQEFMWYIVHSVEKFPMDIYVPTLIKYMPILNLSYCAGEWPIILFVRILNSDEYFAEAMKWLKLWPEITRLIDRDIIDILDRNELETLPEVKNKVIMIKQIVDEKH